MPAFEKDASNMLRRRTKFSSPRQTRSSKIGTMKAYKSRTEAVRSGLIIEILIHAGRANKRDSIHARCMFTDYYTYSLVRRGGLSAYPSKTRLSVISVIVKSAFQLTNSNLSLASPDLAPLSLSVSLSLPPLSYVRDALSNWFRTTKHRWIFDD